MRTEKIYKIIIGSPRKLVLGNGERAIRILEVSNGIPSSSFDDRLVEEIGVPVTTDRPIFFCSVVYGKLHLWLGWYGAGVPSLFGGQCFVGGEGAFAVVEAVLQWPAADQRL
jgi:hypothetical protein